MSAGISRTEQNAKLIKYLKSELYPHPTDEERAAFREIRDLINTHMPSKKSTHGAQSYSLSAAQVNSSKSKSDDLGLKVFQEVFGIRSPFPPIIKMIIGNYIPKATDIFSLVNTPYRDLSVKPFGSFDVNFTDPAALKCYLGKKCRSDEHLASALHIAKRVYEADLRVVGDQEFGFALPLYPEVLAYAMEFLNEDHPKNGKKIAVEMGGASGENAILLGHTDVDKVYNIDIVGDEILTGECLKRQVPPNVSEKLEFIQGNCFDILKIRPALAQKVDLILCRNLIHFFNLEKQIAFLELVKTILKPGGRIICTANAIYPFKKQRKSFEEHPDTTCISVTHCSVTSLIEPHRTLFYIYYEASRLPKHVYRSKVSETVLYTRSPETGFTWKVDNKQFNTLDPALRKKIIKAMKQKNEKIIPIKQGYVKVQRYRAQCYDEQSLSRLFRSRGLEVEATCVVGEDGHLIKDEPFKTGKQTVIICKKPFEK